MRNLFGIACVPSDTHLREILDPLEPRQLRPLFDDVFRQLQRGKALEPFVFYKGCYLLSLDGTGYFSSASIHCDSCLEKVNKQTGEVTYQHQMLAAVLIHPDRREVIPLAPEPIEKQDGAEKNDCERNAAKRLLRHIRQEHPHLKLIVVEDGLASNAPHIRELQKANMHFLLGAKPGDHSFLFDHVLAAFEADPAVAHFAVCMAKTQYSLSHDPKLLGRPKGWTLPVRDFLLFQGAGLVVPVTGDIKLMPGTASNAAFRNIDIDTSTGKVKGLF